MFPFLSIVLPRMLCCNRQQKPTFIAVIVINGKITPLHCLYISVPYIDTEAANLIHFPMQSLKNPVAILTPF